MNVSTLTSTLGTLASSITEGLFSLAKNRSGLFSSFVGDLFNNQSFSPGEYELYKVFLDDDTIDRIFEKEVQLILESDLPFEVKQAKLEELRAEREALLYRRTQQAERISDGMRTKNAAVTGSLLGGMFVLTVVGKKLKVF